MALEPQTQSLEAGSPSTDTAPLSTFAIPPGLVFRSLVPNPDLSITVTEPQKIGSGVNGYTVYKVQTTTTLAEFAVKDVTVQRRFKDFVWLRESLADKHTGHIVPILPDKHGIAPVIGRFDENFIEQRRRALQRFLSRLASHPTLSHSEHLRTFLESSDDDMSAKKSQTKPKPAYMDMFNDVKRKMSSTMMTQVRAGGSKQDELDPVFEQTRNYVCALEAQLADVRRLVERMSLRRRELASVTMEVALSFTTLGKFESSNCTKDAQILVPFSKMADAADAAAQLMQQQADEELLQIVEALDDYTHVVQSIRDSLRSVQFQMQQHAAAQNELDAKRTAQAKLVSAGKDGVSMDGEINDAAVRLENAKKDWDTTSAIFGQDFGRFQEEKSADFRLIMSKLAEIQDVNSAKSRDIWCDLVASAPWNATSEAYEPAMTMPEDS